MQGKKETGDDKAEERRQKVSKRHHRSRLSRADAGGAVAGGGALAWGGVRRGHGAEAGAYSGLTIADQMLRKQHSSVEGKKEAEGRNSPKLIFRNASLQRERVRASIPRTSARYVPFAQKFRENKKN